jgi:hypothetical protein
MHDSHIFTGRSIRHIDGVFHTRPLIVALGLGLFLAAFACDDSHDVCVPGATLACACPGGSSGVQSCNPAGSGFDYCECGTGGSGGGSGGESSTCGNYCFSSSDCGPGEGCLFSDSTGNTCLPYECEDCGNMGYGSCTYFTLTCEFSHCSDGESDGGSGGSECAWTNDNVCDEPEGTGACAEGSDVDDCATSPTSPTCGDYCLYDSDCGPGEGCLAAESGDKCLPYECLDCWSAGYGCNSNSLTCEFNYCS